MQKDRNLDFQFVVALRCYVDGINQSDNAELGTKYVVKHVLIDMEYLYKIDRRTSNGISI